MTLRRSLILFAAVLATAGFLQAQPASSEHSQNTQPTFKEHRIGESAQEFFSIAKMADKNGMISTDYCRAYLNDPKVKKALEKSKKKGGNDQSALLATIDVQGCNSIQAALAGRDTNVELRYAAEFGTGTAQFVAGHLASVTFVVTAPFNDVVEDMNAKLNAKPELGVDTIQNAVGSILKQHRGTWTLPNSLVKIAELHALDGTSAGTAVSVSDPAMMKRRANSLN